MILHILTSLILLGLGLAGIIIGDSGKKTAPLFFVGGIIMCIFFAHLIMLILMKVAGIL
jgi:hypothetical protein